MKHADTPFRPPDPDEDIEGGSDFRPMFDAAGLIPAVVTDARSGEMLMVAFMNRDALARSISTKEAHFWSRSRGRLWRKGEESGNILQIVEMRTDCDQDAIWLKVEIGGAGVACHTGRRTCFYRAIPLGRLPSDGLSLLWCPPESGG